MNPVRQGATQVQMWKLNSFLCSLRLLRFLLFSEQEVSENGEVGELNQLQSLS
jgi:hypothetical protein